MRYSVRRLAGEGQEPLYQVWDTANRFYVATHTREALSHVVADRLNNAHIARLIRLAAGDAS